MTLINTADVTKALVKQLSEHPDLIGFLKNVERGEYVNKDPARTPWCGVYRTEMHYLPKVLGHHPRSWQALLTVKLVVQAHAATGPAAEDACEEAVQKVMTAVLGDLTAQTTMEMLKSVDIEYSYDETKSETIDFQWAFITLVYETRSGI